MVGVAAGRGMADEMKVVFASFTDGPVLVDGVLDEPAWKNTECREDFECVGAPHSWRTKMRLLYDAENLYLGVECEQTDGEAVRKGLAEIEKKHPGRIGFVSISEFTNLHSVEVFLDPNASLINSYQILANAAGQICGQFKGDWNPFPVRPVFKARTTERGWGAEIAFPLGSMPGARLMEGGEWGFNLARNDDRPSAIWKKTGSVYYEPNRYGRMVIGNYETWWRKRVDEGVFQPVAAIAKQMGRSAEGDSSLKPMLRELQLQMENLRKMKEKMGLSSHDDFMIIYHSYLNVERLARRFLTLCTAVALDQPKGENK